MKHFYNLVKLGLCLVLLSSSAYAGPVDDVRTGLNCAMRGTGGNYTYNLGIFGSGGGALNGSNWFVLTKPPGSLTGTCLLSDLVPELNSPIPIVCTGVDIGGNKIRWIVTAPDAIGQTFPFTLPNNFSANVKVTAFTGTLHTGTSILNPAIADPITSVLRNVGMVWDSSQANTLTVTGQINGNPALPCTATANPVRHEGFGGFVNVRTTSGRILFQDFDFGNGTPPATATIEFKDSGFAVVDSKVTALANDGTFQVDSPAAPGNHYVSVKVRPWLRRTIGPYDTGNSLAGLVLELINGDVDDDNEVNLVDYSMLANAFGFAIGDPEFDPYTDLNGDGETNLGDLAILSANFGAIGND